ncbi:Aspartate dehydrogenase domain-containing protein [Balamuthia mandrillaris]
MSLHASGGERALPLLAAVAAAGAAVGASLGYCLGASGDWAVPLGGKAKKKRRTRVGVVGYGSLGQYLVSAILQDPKISQEVELAFVWNRTVSKITEDTENHIPPHLILHNLENFASKKADLIVEVAHPSISLQYGEAFLREADYFVGSPTVLADPILERQLRQVLADNNAGRSRSRGRRKTNLYVPAGAFWGAHDIQKMAQRGSLTALSVTMRKHPSSLRLEAPLQQKLDQLLSSSSSSSSPSASSTSSVQRHSKNFSHSLEENEENAENEDDGGLILYEGPVRELCPLAPQNVNTMACAALAAENLGFDQTIGRLVADPHGGDAHIIQIQVEGINGFRVYTTRLNPAAPGAVTGSATYRSFLSSLLVAATNAPSDHSSIRFC